jgi:hypothetical protein
MASLSEEAISINSYSVYSWIMSAVLQKPEISAPD